MPVFVVGHIDWNENELRLERIEAANVQEAVTLHSHYPWKDYPNDAPQIRGDGEAFKQTCFDCDCMMSWIEV